MELLAGHSLVLKEILGDGNELFAVLAEDLLAKLGSLVEDALDLGVDEGGGILGVALCSAEIAADEDALAGAVEGDGTEFIAHTVNGDHIAGNARCLLDITGCACGNIVKEELFGNASAKAHNDIFKHFAAGTEVFQILLRTEEGEAACHTAGNDRDIVDRVGMLEILAGNGVTCLVVSGELSCLVADLLALLLGTHLNLQYGLFNLGHSDEAASVANSHQRGLVHKVFKVCAGKAGSSLCDGVEVNIVAQWLALGVDAENGFASADIGKTNINLTVKATGTEKGIIKNVCAVGGRHNDYAVIIAEAVHFNQQLVEGLLALIVTAAQT